MVKVIIVTGTPGTGKTTLAKALAKRLGFIYVDVNKVIEKCRLSEGYDQRRRCKIVDTENLSKALIKSINRASKSLVIDSHLSHYLPPEFVGLCIVTRCRLGELKKRLEAKGYNEKKVRENLDCEITDFCLIEAKELGHDVLEVDTTNGFDLCKTSAAVVNRLSQE